MSEQVTGNPCWKGRMTFGLTEIPYFLTPAARTRRISFQQLHSTCLTRLRQPMFCSTCNRAVERNEIEKGYEYEKGKYLLLSQETIASIKPDSAHWIEMRRFIPADAIDPLYFDSCYSISPDSEKGWAAYRMVNQALAESSRVAVSAITMHNRESACIIRPYGARLLLHTLFYEDEARLAPSPHPAKIDPDEMRKAMELVAFLSEPRLNLERRHDPFADAIQNLLRERPVNRKLFNALRRK